MSLPRIQIPVVAVGHGPRRPGVHPRLGGSRLRHPCSVTTLVAPRRDSAVCSNIGFDWRAHRRRSSLTRTYPRAF